MTITGGGKRTAAIAAFVAACLFGLPGIAGADANQKLTIELVPSTVPEGAGAELTFKVKLEAGPDPATFNYSTGGTATAGTDYTSQSGTQQPLEPGGEFVVHVPIIDDTLDEFDGETVVLTLNEITGADPTPVSATGSITDNDAEPSIASISDATVAEGNVEGNTTTTKATIKVKLSAASGKPVTVPFSTAPGTAGTDDFVEVAGNLIIPPGATEGDIEVNVKRDALFEPDEKFSVVITAPTNAQLGADNRGEITITNDDGALVPTVPNVSRAEGNAGTVDLIFKVTLGGPRPVTRFNLRTVAGSATGGGADYLDVDGRALEFEASASATTKDVPVTLKADIVDELDETFTLQLLNPTTGAVVTSATGTITNDDNNSKLTISDSTADEAGTMKFTVKLEPVSGRTVTVNWATANGTATAGSDYTAAGDSLTFAPGAGTIEISVPVLGDAFNEENETLKVLLSGATGVPEANVTDAEGLGTIVDKNAPPSLSVSDTTAREGEGASFTVTLAGTTLRTVTVGFSTGDGAARAGSDYVARVGTLTFAPGEKTKTLSVTVTDDAVSEPTEDFAMRLSDPVNATITKALGRATIEASDQVPGAPTPPVATPVEKKTPAKVLTPRIVLGPRAVAVGANGIARMLVTCQRVSPITCAGSVELERAARPLLKLGKKTFSVKKGTKAYAAIKLTPRALTILRRNGTMRVKVIVVVKTTAKDLRVSPGVVTLTAPKTKPKPKVEPPPQVEVTP